MTDKLLAWPHPRLLSLGPGLVHAAGSDGDPRSVPHEDVRAWLLRLAEGEFDAPPPEPR